MSTLDFRHLPGDRLATTDEVGRRMWIIPARVRGAWKDRKRLLHLLLLTILLVTPWLRWQGEPVVLLNIAERQFIFFGKVFSAHDGPLIFFILGLLTLGLALMTALWGRIWCGWACPQTVFIEQIFRPIESWIIGSRAEQIDCYKNLDNPKNFFKVLIKWILFFLMAAIISHSFIAYFVSWEKLLFMMTRPPSESWTVFLFTFAITSLLAFDLGWFREQFCIIMCPYGRIQSVLMDSQSITVAYDYLRGEPRTQNIKQPPTGRGDCIDCFRCVSVCPTGIDIRKGQQLECIGCTACIDACDEVMEKISRPKGLIRYSSLARLQGLPQIWFRPRIIGYLVIMGLIFSGFAYCLAHHESLYFSILRRNELPYAVNTELGEEVVLNNYRLHVRNPNREKLTLVARIESTEATMGPVEIAAELAPGESRYLPFFIKFPSRDFNSLRDRPVPMNISYQIDGQQNLITRTLQVVGPKSLSQERSALE